MSWVTGVTRVNMKVKFICQCSLKPMCDWPCHISTYATFPCFSRGFHQASVLLTTFHLFSQVITILAQTMQVTLFMTAKQANKTATGNGKPPCISTIHITHRDLSTSHLVPRVFCNPFIWLSASLLLNHPTVKQKWTLHDLANISKLFSGNSQFLQQMLLQHKKCHEISG